MGDVFSVKDRQNTFDDIVSAAKIPGTGEPDGLPSVGSHRVGND